MSALRLTSHASTRLAFAALALSGCAYDFDAAFADDPIAYAGSDAGTDVSQDVASETADDVSADIASEAADVNFRPDVVGDAFPDQDADATPDSPDDAPDDISQDVNDTGSDACPPLTKLCGASCVPLDDPATGCASGSCLPCNLPHAYETCGDNGACAVESCVSDYGDCNNAPQDGCETPLFGDPSNCGSCGYGCCGGTCELGACSAGALVPGNVSVPAIANDSTFVYWLDEVGTLRRVQKDGIAPTTVCTVEPDGGTFSGDDGALVLDGQYAYFGFAEGSVYRVAKTATNAQPDMLTPANAENGAIIDMTRDGNVLFFTVRTTLHYPGSAYQMNTDGSSKYSVLMSGDDDPTAIAVNDTHVFYLQYPSRTLTAKSRTAPTATNLVNFGRLSDLVVDGSQLYYADPSGERVGRISTSLTAGSNEVLYDDADSTPIRIAVDATHVYFTDAGKTPAVARIAKATLDYEVVASSQGMPRAITDDDTCVFWATTGTGPVQGARK